MLWKRLNRTQRVYQRSYNNYATCISILKEKISSFVISQIKTYDESIDFTTVSDLISASEFFLKDSIIARRLEHALALENEMEQIENLLIICEQYNIK